MNVLFLFQFGFPKMNTKKKNKKEEEEDYSKNIINLKKEIKIEQKNEERYLLLNMFNIVFAFSINEPMN